jgi:RNA polymerase sigma-70 factor, ECF subfamily
MDSPSADQFVSRFLAVQAQIYGYIATLVPNRGDAEDLFQQTALVLWTKREQFDPSREILPWALGIAHNEVRRYLRRRGRSATQLSDALVERLAELHYASVGKEQGRVERLADCMAKLTEGQRALIEQCYLGAESIKQIAEKRHLDPTALYKRLDRIRWALLDCIEAAERREEHP